MHPAAADLLQGCWFACRRAQMWGTTAALRAQVFGSGRCLQFEPNSQTYTFKPYAELLMRTLWYIAEQRGRGEKKDHYARSVFRLAGF